MLAFHLSRVPVCGVWVTIDGAQLPDPKKLFNAWSGWEHVAGDQLSRGDTIDKTPLKVLRREAVAYNAWHIADRLGPWICLRDM